MTELSLLAPAKLNLFLHILGRRPDGYHQLQTLFQLLDYGDNLHFQITDNSEIQLNQDIPGLAQEDNLIVKAAKLLQQQSSHKLGAIISLEKRLPMGGGLGGGSSDAATTLLALNHLWQLNLDIPSLAELGMQLGADVPVFIHGKTAWAEGIGEQLTPVELAENWYLVISPNCHVSTAEIFANPDLTRDTHPIKIRAFLEQGGRNDCQKVAEKLFPEVRKARRWLDQFTPAQMTGSGACIFARFSDQESAVQTLSQLPGYWQGFVAKGVNQSPTLRLLYS